MLINKLTPTVAVALKDGHSYHGIYRVDVTHLAKSMLGHLILLIVFTAAFVPLVLVGAPQWLVWPCGMIAVEAFLNLLMRAVQIVRNTRDQA